MDSAEAVDTKTIETALSRHATGNTKGLLLSLPLAQVAVFGAIAAIQGFLLPVQVQEIMGGNTDVFMLGLAATAGGITAIIGSPVVGILSDRTRSKFGRRAPWMFVTAMIAAVFLVLMANADYIVVLALAYAIVSLGLYGYQATLLAILPDRVHQEQYNKYSGVMGIGLNLGSLLPAAVFALWPQLASRSAYYLLAAVLVLSAIVFAVASPDVSSEGNVTRRFRLRDLVSVFWVSPRQAPNFAIVFVARLLLLFGYFLVFAFFYYLLQDYIKLNANDAISVMGWLFLINGAAAVIGAWGVAQFGSRIQRLKPVVTICGVVLASSTVILLVAPSFGGIVAWSIVNGLATGSYFAVDASLTVRVLPNPETPGKDLGVMNLTTTVPIMFSAAIGAVFVGWWGYPGLLIVASAVAVVGGFLVLFVKGVR